MAHYFIARIQVSRYYDGTKYLFFDVLRPMDSNGYLESNVCVSRATRGSVKKTTRKNVKDKGKKSQNTQREEEDMKEVGHHFAWSISFDIYGSRDRAPGASTPASIAFGFIVTTKDRRHQGNTDPLRSGAKRKKGEHNLKRRKKGQLWM